MLGKRGTCLTVVIAALMVLGATSAALADNPVTVTQGWVYAADPVPGWGLDLQGNFAYALNFTNETTTYTIFDAAFTPYGPTTVVPGVTTNILNVFNYETNGYGQVLANHFGYRDAEHPNYDTENAALNHIMNTGGTSDDLVHYYGNNPVAIDLTVTPGATYKLQVLQHEPYWSLANGGANKWAQVTISGTASGVSPLFQIACGGQTGFETHYSNVVGAEFTATTSNLHVSWLNYDDNGNAGDWSRLSGLTLELLSAPPATNSALTASPASGATLDFTSSLPDRTKTLTSAVTLTNSGDAGTTLKITGVDLGGANPTMFAFSGAVNDVLPATPGQAYNVQFLGTHLPGTYTATLTLTTDAVQGSNVATYALSAVVARLIGDANLDNHVNFTDYLALEQTFNTAVANDTGADFTKDGLVNFSDYLALEQNFNTSGAAVPEPMTLSLLGLGALALIRRRK